MIGSLPSNIISGLLETVQLLMEVVKSFRLFAMLVLLNYQSCLLMGTYCMKVIVLLMHILLAL